MSGLVKEKLIDALTFPSKPIAERARAVNSLERVSKQTFFKSQIRLATTFPTPGAVFPHDDLFFDSDRIDLKRSGDCGA